MKKFLVMLFMFVGVSGSIWASNVTLEGNQIKTEVIDNTTGQYLDTNVAVTTIYPRYDKILGFEILPITTASENVVAVHDATTGDTLGNTNLFGEAECAPESFDGLWFPYPREITTGITVRQGAQTRVIIYYVRG